MNDAVKPRAYNAAGRREAARRTRQAILAAALQRFTAQGYAETTMRQIADDAGIALDTIYASVGTKPQLFRLLVETAISGTDEEVPLMQRQYVRAIAAEPDPGRKIAIYLGAVRRFQARLAPLFRVWQRDAGLHPDLAAIWSEMDARRRRNFPALVDELAKTGALNGEWTAHEIADQMWVTNSTAIYVLLVQERGWTPERYEYWLTAMWKRLFLRSAPDGDANPPPPRSNGPG